MQTYVADIRHDRDQHVLLLVESARVQAVSAAKHRETPVGKDTRRQEAHRIWRSAPDLRSHDVTKCTYTRQAGLLHC